MSKKRFYEQNTAVKQAVNTLLLFPEDIQEIIAAGFSQIAQRDYKLKEILDNLKTLGVDVIMAFHKSKRKQREYDKNPIVHKALNDLMIIGPENQVLLAHQALELMNCLQNYLRLCKDFEILPQKNILQTLADAYVTGGKDDANIYLNRMNQELKEQFPERIKIILSLKNSTIPLDEAIRSESAGMKVKGELLKP